MLLTTVAMVAMAAADAGVSDAGARDGGLSMTGSDAGVPSVWRLSQRLDRDGGVYTTLLKDLTADGGAAGEMPLSAAEASALFDDPRAQLVYGEKTVSIVAPSMKARHRQEHLDLMKLFLAPERVKAGAEFAKKYETALSAAETKTGVDRNVIIGILMWESKLGTITGDYRAFNVFTSQLFFIDDANAVALGRVDEKVGLDEVAQAKRVVTIRERARKNLVSLARQCKARGIDMLEVKGSWAGALGFPQFMPASLQWAEDGNGDGVIDLFVMEDSIASIGRYLQAHGFAASREKAVWGYNHEDAYVQGVLAFADALAALADAGTPAKKK